MKVLFFFSVFFVAQIIYSKALGLNARNWNNNAFKPLNTGIVKPKLWMWKNLFGFKNRGRAGQLKNDFATPSKFKIKGTAALKNGNLKLDLAVDPNKVSGVLVAASPEVSTPPTLPTSATTSGPATTAVISGPTSGITVATTAAVTTGAGITTAVGGSTSPPGLTSTAQPTLASSGPPTTSPITSATTSAPATTGAPSGPTTGTTIPTAGAGITSTSGIPTTAVGTTSVVTTIATLKTPTTLATSSTMGSPASTLPTSKPTLPVGATSVVTTIATLTTPTTLATSSTMGSPASTPPTSKPTLPVGATTISTGVQTTIPVVTTSGTAMPTTKPSGAVQNKICIVPGKVYVIIVAKEVKNAHNAYRRTHGSPDLQLDDQMICDAQKFAQRIAFNGVLEHQSSEILARKGLGENIGMSCTPARNGPLNYDKVIRMVRSVTKRWYDEVCEYNFDKPDFAPRTGHFTEVVWSGSRKLGVGYAVGKNAKFPGYVCVYVVGRYSPAGNNIGAQRLATNVKRGNFNDAYCKRRSKAPSFTLIPVDKRNHLKNKVSYAKKY